MHRRKDGGWVGVLDLGWLGGKRRRRYVYAKSEREAVGKLAELRRARERGQNLLAAPRTVGEWLAEWLSMKAAQGTRPLTLERYGDVIRLHIEPALGRVRLERLTPTEVRRLLEAKTGEGLSPQTVGHVHAVLRNALSDAERHELVSRNVAKAVRPPSVRRAEQRFLTVPEARRLLEVVRGDRLEALWVCALTLGLRRGELLGLRWADVDFDAALLRVRQAVQRANGALVVGEVKTDRSRRTLPLPLPTLTALLAHRERLCLEAGAYRWEGGLPDLVFVSLKGGPLEPRNVARRWYQLRREADLEWLRLHDLRHACASFLLAAGASPRTVMQTLGHSQITLTMNTYAHVLPEVERAAVDAAADRLFG